VLGESRISRGRRAAACALASALLIGLVGAVPAQADSTNFHPVVTAGLGTDAARAPSSFSLKITQNDGEEQIGRLAITLPRNPGFMVNTDVPGSNGGQIGTIRVVLYTDPRPGTLTIEGTLNDDNGRVGCHNIPRQCIVANLNVAGQNVQAKLEINELTGAYSIEGDLTGTWADPSVGAIDARLAELSTTLFAKAGAHTIVTNPAAADTWPLTYSLTSASVPGRSIGDRTPTCGTVCTIPLTTREYAPTRPGLQTPANGAAYLASASIPFSWAPSSDANGDTLTYKLFVDDTEVVPLGPTGRTASVSLPPGLHEWRVQVDDGHGRTNDSVVWKVTTIDGATALRFVSATNADVLYVDPVRRAFVYQVANGGQYGGISPTANGLTGYIAFNGGFTLAATYDDTTRSAAGTFVGSGQTRPFLDPPGS